MVGYPLFSPHRKVILDKEKLFQMGVVCGACGTSSELAICLIAAEEWNLLQRPQYAL